MVIEARTFVAVLCGFFFLNFTNKHEKQRSVRTITVQASLRMS